MNILGILSIGENFACNQGAITNAKAEYHIGDNILITRECKIRKKGTVPTNCVVAAGAVVTKKFDDCHAFWRA